MKTLALTLLVTLVSAFLPTNLTAETFGHGSEAKKPDYDKDILKTLAYREIGPFRGGRSVAVAGHDAQPYTYYVGYTGGGVYKTIDGGNSWSNISDDDFKTGSVGAIDVADSDPNVIYVGMGETDIRGNLSAGDGMYRSTDAGKSWQYLGLGESRFIGDIEIHPTNPDVVWVAVMGKLFGKVESEERGVYKTTDGGKTWNRVLYRDAHTGAVDIALDPNNPRILYAGMWQAHRNEYEMSSGGPKSGLFKSTDGGKTWTDLTKQPGMPKGMVGKVGVSVSAVNSNLVYAMVENAKGGGLFRSEDAGESWKRVSADRNLRQRAWYYTKVITDPSNADVVYVLNVRFWKSIDGGKTFKSISTPHADHHDLWIASNNSQRMVIGDDGGGQVTYNGGASWSSYHTSATAQIYQVAIDNQFPYLIYGAQQDNSTFAIMNRTSDSGITEEDWWPVAGCESGYLAVDPDNHDVTYGGCYGGYMSKYNAKLRLSDRVDVWPDNPMGAGADQLKYRFQWTFPIIISPHNPDVLYATSQFVHRSTDEGMSWEVISEDLTRNDKSKQGESGGPITKDDTSVEYYNTIFTLVESPIEPGLLWAGSDDGLIHISRDNGKTWNNVTPRRLPESMISIIDASHHEPGTAYFAATRYKFGDFKPMIYKTDDYGRSWEKITRGIPATDFTRAVREDPNKSGLLYAGTETGVYVSFDAGEKWQPLQLNLPATPVTDLAVHKRDKDLVIATQGRSFWVLDDLPVLHQLTEDMAEKGNHLLKPEDTYLYGTSFKSSNPVAGDNPDFGAVVFFKLDESQEQEVTLEFIDPNGKSIRTYSSQKDAKDKAVKPSPLFYEEEGVAKPSVLTNNAGMNRFVWNLGYPGVTDLDGRQILWAGNTRGPRAVPGDYKVKMSIGDKVVGEQSFAVMKDPRLTDVTQADLQAQFDLVQTINMKLDETHIAINDIRKSRKSINEKMADSEDEDLKKRVKAMLESLSNVENALVQTKAEAIQDVLNYPIKLNNKLASLKSTVAQGYARPTAQEYEVYEALAAQVDAELAKLKEVMDGEYAEYSKLLGN